MLPVPKLRQPDETSCLPTCVQAVFEFLGYGCSPEEIREWCFTTKSGCDADLAIQGLRDAGYDVTFNQQSMTDLREMIDAGFPPIIVLREREGWYHAVVVCEINEVGMILMDPHLGEYQFVSHASLLEKWIPGHGDVMQIGKACP